MNRLTIPTQWGTIYADPSPDSNSLASMLELPWSTQKQALPPIFPLCC